MWLLAVAGAILAGYYLYDWLRANQTVTCDELIEDIKQGTADTESVVQQYSSNLLSRDQARCNVINEIITAERDYVKHLHDIAQGYIRKARERTDMFTDEQVELIFGNVADIYEMSQQFLVELEKTVSEAEDIQDSLIGHCFLCHKAKFEIYSSYCNNHPRAVDELQRLNADSKYSHFFEACRLLQNMINLPLEAFLLTPIQKICKYPLQLAELLKYTHINHPDHQHLQDALSAMKDMAMYINERKRKLESVQKISEWQAAVLDWQDDDLLATSSELIHSGELSKLSQAGRLVERHFFLFDHQLIQCKKELLKKCLVYKSRLSLDDHTVEPIEDGTGNHKELKNVMEVRDSEGTAVLVLCAKSQSQMEKWMKSFQRERKVVQQDLESGFQVTESFKALAQLNSPPKATKPNKVAHNPANRKSSDSSNRNSANLDTTDSNSSSSLNNNSKHPIGKKAMGFMNKLRKGKVAV